MIYARVLGTKRAIKLLSETVGTVQGPAKTLKGGPSAFFNWERGVGPFGEEEERTDDDKYDDGPGPWYDDSTDEGDNEEDEDEDGFIDY